MDHYLFHSPCVLYIIRHSPTSQPRHRPARLCCIALLVTINTFIIIVVFVVVVVDYLPTGSSNMVSTSFFRSVAAWASGRCRLAGDGCRPIGERERDAFLPVGVRSCTHHRLHWRGHLLDPEGPIPIP